MASFKHKNTRIWIDYPNRKDREYEDLDLRRFHVEIVNIINKYKLNPIGVKQ